MTHKEIALELRSLGVNPTRPRIEILKYVKEHFTHPSIEEVFAYLSPLIPTLSKTTVYNTMRKFSEMGLCTMLTINEKQLVFDGDTTPHAHFICKNCNKVYDIPLDAQILRKVKDTISHETDEVHLYFRGICEDCKAKK